MCPLNTLVTPIL